MLIKKLLNIKFMIVSKKRKYKTSTNYKKLWELLNKGYNIVAWAYNEKTGDSLPHVIEIKYIEQIQGFGNITLGEIGIIFGNEYDVFKMLCGFWNIKFIDINN